MYDKNLIVWLKTELKSYVDIDSSKIRDSEQYFKLFESKYAKVLRDFDFTNLTIPERYITLNDEQKASIREFAKIFLIDSCDYERYLSLLCKIGAQFERADLNGSPEYTAILTNYHFLKELWRERYPTAFNEFEQQKRGFTEAIKPQTTNPNCIECNSSNVASKGIMWNCRSCGRSWLKNPRKHNRVIVNQ